ncbi:rod shape-determining protein MreD [Robertmurraya kyonggiensis]|uniref:Rod shape-determining protein MreD n=1 Tax=Robertmurraya kyonggiensis TaxID=1037680 RepID=A0A4V5P214_9BACI|nr:rod shape-determining protein MreD [Robertmurraya kyonggiensis]TKC20080.1 rod shape-determining protein MreD [Robertmurraya kyonggiensis]
MRKYLLPLLFILFFILESLFVQTLPAEVFNSERILAPRFLMIVILFMTLYGHRDQGLVYGLVFGLLFDVVYTEIIGIYLFMFPLIAYIASKLMRILQSNIVVVSVISILCVVLLELGVYEMNYLINITNMDFSLFLNQRLFPTIVLNLAFIIIFAYPLKRIFEKYATSLRED